MKGGARKSTNSLETKMTDTEIASLCQIHGAKAVSDAAYAAMNGSHSGFRAFGVSVIGLGVLHRITTIAYKLMGPADQALDLTQASISAAKIKV
jgi:hypothetical protein